MNFRGLLLIAGGTMIGVAGGVGSMLYVTRPIPVVNANYAAAAPAEAPHETEDPPDEGVVVNTIRPKRDKAFTVASNQLASVEAYYQANLRARTAGVVKYIPKDVGAPVSQGELLCEVDVPDLLQEVAQKEAVIEQRRQEMLVAKAKVKDAVAQLEVARANIDQQKTLVDQADATRKFRESRWQRFKKMVDDKSAPPDAADEEGRNYLAAVAAWEFAKVAVRKAQADCQEKEASLEGAQADVELRQSLIEVARKDRDRTRALADYAKLTAPFDGVIVRREVDLGTFVQNATTGVSDPLVSIARTDIVTVAARLRDNEAPFVSTNTEVSLLFDELPGVVVEGKITRYSPSVQTIDRTMRVEVDLFNGSRAEYQKFLAQYLECRLAPLMGAAPFPALSAAAAGRETWGPRLKSDTDPLPGPPPLAGPRDQGRRLLPGMTGHMRINLEKLGDSYLLPSTAVFTRGGKPFIMEVRNGIVHLVPVRVPVYDGRISKVMVIAHAANARTGTQETLHELTGTEEIVASRQGELTDGQAVRTTQVDW
ncbi:MAG TPA: efflux RND transporter periplasmic adaptor subunit [Gemmataceae bacterium]|jgi:multidrug resistance efflux pump|nr:efflux RND transporter periplasmic adaptor subunit [Gemmataceae bacterium]